VGRVLYDPYGEIVESTLPPDLTEQLFTGQTLDSYMELYLPLDGHSRHRFLMMRPQLIPGEDVDAWP
jgi:hypothetical protein